MITLFTFLKVTLGFTGFFFLFRGRKKSSIPASEVTLSQAWDYYFTHSEQLGDRDRKALSIVCTRLSDSQLGEIKTSLLALEAEANDSADRLREFREAIMEATDQFVLAEALTSQDEAGADSHEYLEGVIKAGVLRCYTEHRFNDFAERDWYSHYLGLCEMNVKNVATMIKKTAQGEQALLETTLHGPMSASMTEARALLLEYPKATPVDKLRVERKDPEESKGVPSEDQMRELIQLMSNRFKRLFTGQLYHWPDGPSVNPAEAFRLDGGLLLSQLGIRYPKAQAIWREIVDRSFKSIDVDTQFTAIQLESSAQEYQQVWNNTAGEGALFGVLKEAAPRTFTCPESNPSKSAFDPETLALRMSDDAIALIRGITRILKQPN